MEKQSEFAIVQSALSRHLMLNQSEAVKDTESYHVNTFISSEKLCKNVSQIFKNWIYKDWVYGAFKKKTAGWWTVVDALGHLCHMQHHDIRSDVLGWVYVLPINCVNPRVTRGIGGGEGREIDRREHKGSLFCSSCCCFCQ